MQNRLSFIVVQMTVLLGATTCTAWIQLLGNAGSRMRTQTTLGMGLFDFVKDAFANEAFDDRRAAANHILVDSEEEALVVMKEIQEGGKSFADAAKTYSSCPSGSNGGSLGSFEPGQMVQEFDNVVFDAEKSPIGEVIGPVATQFGFHLIQVVDRFENQVKSDGSGAF